MTTVASPNQVVALYVEWNVAYAATINASGAIHGFCRTKLRQHRVDFDVTSAVISRH
jgi:hypothetical protein